MTCCFYNRPYGAASVLRPIVLSVETTSKIFKLSTAFVLSCEILRTYYQISLSNKLIWSGRRTFLATPLGESF